MLIVSLVTLILVLDLIVTSSNTYEEIVKHCKSVHLIRQGLIREYIRFLSVNKD